MKATNRDLIFGYPAEQLEASEETRLYSQNMWDKKYGLGLYFSALHELGFHMIFGMKVGEKWYYFSHALFDGINALQYLDKKLALNLKLAMVNKRKQPRGFKLIKPIFSALASKPKEAHNYINQSAYTTSADSVFFLCKFAKTDIKDNLTAYLLKKTNDFCLKHFCENESLRWMIPVNVADENSLKDSKMKAVYIGYNCSSSYSVDDIKSHLKNKLVKGEHWGNLALANFGIHFGKRILVNGTRKSLAKKKSKWFGNFSNVGEIGNQVNQPITIVSTVRWHRPIGVGIYILNDIIHYTFAIHNSLGISESKAQKLKDEFYQAVIQ